MTVTGRTESKDQILRKATSSRIIEIDRQRSQGRSFSTSPAIRRHVSKFPSYYRLTAFMQQLWEKGLKKSCSYGTLVFEWTQFTGTNDRRTVERYLGKPKHAVRSHGRSTVTRLNRTSGKVAQFEYMNTRYVPEKKGLAQKFGFITFMKVKPNHYPNEDGRLCFLHHEALPYFTEQVTLSSIQEAEGVVASKDDLRVCPLYAQDGFVSHGCEETEGKVEPIDSIERKNEEEAIDCTHTFLQCCDYASEHTRCASVEELTPEELKIIRSASKEGG